MMNKTTILLLATLVNFVFSSGQRASSDDLGPSIHFVLNGNPQTLLQSVKTDDSYKYLEAMFDEVSGIEIRKVESVILAWTDSETDKGSGSVDAILGLRLSEKIDQKKLRSWIHTFAFDELKESDRYPGFYSTGEFGNGVYFYDSKTVFLASSDPLGRLIASKQMDHLANFFSHSDKNKLAEFSFQANETSKAFFKKYVTLGPVPEFRNLFTAGKIEAAVGEISAGSTISMEIVISSESEGAATVVLENTKEFLGNAIKDVELLKQNNQSRRSYIKELKDDDPRRKSMTEDIDAATDFIAVGQKLLPKIKVAQDGKQVRLSMVLKVAPEVYVKPVLRHMAAAFRSTPWGRRFERNKSRKK